MERYGENRDVILTDEVGLSGNLPFRGTKNNKKNIQTASKQNKTKQNSFFYAMI